MHQRLLEFDCTLAHPVSEIQMKPIAMDFVDWHHSHFSTERSCHYKILGVRIMQQRLGGMYSCLYLPVRWRQTILAAGCTLTQHARFDFANDLLLDVRAQPSPRFSGCNLCLVSAVCCHFLGFNDKLFQDKTVTPHIYLVNFIGISSLFLNLPHNDHRFASFQHYNFYAACPASFLLGYRWPLGLWKCHSYGY